MRGWGGGVGLAYLGVFDRQLSVSVSLSGNSLFVGDRSVARGLVL